MRKTRWKSKTILASLVLAALAPLPAAADSVVHLSIMPGARKVHLDLEQLWGSSHTDATVLTSPRFGGTESATDAIIYAPGSLFATVGADDFTLVDGADKLTIVLTQAETTTQYFDEAQIVSGELSEGWEVEEEDGEVDLGDGTPLFTTANGGVIYTDDGSGGNPQGQGTGCPCPPPGGLSQVTTPHIATFLKLGSMARAEIRENTSELHDFRMVFVHPNSTESTTQWYTNVDLNAISSVELWLNHDLMDSSGNVLSGLSLRLEVRNNDTAKSVLFLQEMLNLEGDVSNITESGAGLFDATAPFTNAITFGRPYVFWTTAATPPTAVYEDILGGSLTSPWTKDSAVSLALAHGNYTALTDVTAMGTPAVGRVKHASASNVKHARMIFNVDMTAVDLAHGESLCLASGSANDTTPESSRVFDLLVQNLSSTMRIWVRGFDTSWVVQKTPVMSFNPETPLQIAIHWVKGTSSDTVLTLVVNGVVATAMPYSSASINFEGALIGPAQPVLSGGSNRNVRVDRILLTY